MGIGLLPVTIALAVLGIPPLLAGTYAGVRNVDRSVVDAARGVGMRESQVLFQVELPNALPLILGGLRAASLQVIATAAVAAYVSFGGLGRFLIDGLRTRDYPQMAAGAVLVAVLALLVEAVLALGAAPGRLAGPARRAAARAVPRPPRSPGVEPDAGVHGFHHHSRTRWSPTMKRTRTLIAGVGAGLLLLLAACGGGGGGSDPARPRRLRAAPTRARSGSARPTSRRTGCSPRSTRRPWRRPAQGRARSSASAAVRSTSRA